MGRARRPARSLLVVALAALASCSGADVLAGSWQAVNIGPRPTVPDVISTAEFVDGEVSGSGGCNSYSGTYEAEGVSDGEEGSISISNVGGTEMACEDLVMAQEAAFYEALTSAATYRVVVDRLELRDAGGELLIAFVRRGDGS